MSGMVYRANNPPASQNGVAIQGVHPSKHDGKDRSGLKGNRGNVKKKGGGGGFTWGKPGDELNAPSVLSKSDPNYDSEIEDDHVVLVSTQETQERLAKKAGVPVLNGALYHSNGTSVSASYQYGDPSNIRIAPKTPMKAFKLAVVKLIDELFTSEDSGEFMRGVSELESSILHYELVRRLVTISMERNDREREMASQTLSLLRLRGVVSLEQCGKGFERIFELIDDIVLDIPHAKKYVAQFLARAIVDEALPPSFLSDPLVESLGGDMVEQAKVLLSIKHGVVRLERVWGLGEGSPVDELKPEIKMILMEYLSSSDLDEACECIKRMKVAHFNHEVVKRAVVIAMDMHQRERAMMSSLLAELLNREVVSLKQFELGFTRLVEAADDLELDTPGAKLILDVFITQAVSDGCLDQGFAEHLQKQIG